MAYILFIIIRVIHKSMKKRLDLLDIAKGICIILMTITHFPRITAHIPIVWLNHTVFMAFKMPLFFMISGYLTNLKGSLKKFFLTKADALLKTTLNVVLLFSVLLFIKSRDIDILLHLGHSLVNGTVFPVEVSLYPLWFPIALFISLFIVRWMMTIEKYWRKIYFIPFLALVYTVLFVLYHYHVSFYFMDTLIFSVGFIHFGALLRNRIDPEQLEYFCGKHQFFLLSAMIFVTLCVFSSHLHLNLDIGIANGEKLGDHLLLTLVKTLTGAYTLLYLALQLGRMIWLKNFLVWCARASFIILAFHIKVTAMLFKLLDPLGHHWYLSVLVFVANILVCLLLFRLLNKVGILRLIFLPSYGTGTSLTMINTEWLIRLVQHAKHSFQYTWSHVKHLKQVFNHALIMLLSVFLV